MNRGVSRGDHVKNIFPNILMESHAICSKATIEVLDYSDECVQSQKEDIRITRSTDPDNIYLSKVNDRNTRKRFEVCSKLTIKTPEQR